MKDPEPPPLPARKPDWLRVAIPSGENVRRMGELLRRRKLATVCEEARCPNKAECWGCSTATFMIMGRICTRGCRFCAVDHRQKGQALDPAEPAELARMVSELGLRYVVLTSVDRDDLPDRGSAHFAACLHSLKALRETSLPGLRIEALIPDYHEGEIEALLAETPDVLAHNVETVPRLQSLRDPRASFEGSLHCLRLAAAYSPRPVVKTSLMLGLGESDDELFQTMDRLRGLGCDSLVMGQYLQPTRSQAPVLRYVHPEDFARYAKEAKKRGFSSVISSPLARTSYHARDSFEDSARHLPAPGPDTSSTDQSGSPRLLRLDRKEAGEKLVRVEITLGSRLSQGSPVAIVERLRINGDFFAHPEEAFEAAEASLQGIDAKDLPESARRAFSDSSLSFYGVSADSIVRALECALTLAESSGQGDQE